MSLGTLGGSLLGNLLTGRPLSSSSKNNKKEWVF